MQLTDQRPGSKTRQTPAVPYAHSFQLHLESDLFASPMLYGLSLREVIAFSSAHLLAKPSSAEKNVSPGHLLLYCS